MVVILFGVSGAGKTTVGQVLAEQLGWQFYDADDFHSAASKEKMHAGLPLTDEDRQPWLASLRELIERILATKQDAVLACSALTRSYRDSLLVSEAVRFVYLHGSYDLIAGRLRKRREHFMNPDLLRSQFATLEEPLATENVMTIEVRSDPQELAGEIKKKL